MGAYDGEDFYGCPRQKIEPASYVWLELYGHYDKGLMWTAGGIADQPLHYVRAMGVIRDAVARFEREQVEQEKELARMKTRTMVRRQ